MGAVAAAAVLAHQGGWDEALFVAVPMTVLVGLLWLAQKRAADEERADEEGSDARGAGRADPGPDRHPGPDPDRHPDRR